MTPEFHYDIEQRSPEWYALRCGLITASNFGALLAQGEGKMRDSLIRRVAAEIVTGEPVETYTNAYMERGRQQEAEARSRYALVKGCDPKPIGFIKRGRTGASPDSLIGKNKALEIKTEKADLLVATLLRNEFPQKHIAQTQGHLWISERDKVDLVIYCPKMPLFCREAGRDERFIARLSGAVDKAYEEIDLMVRRIKGYM